MTQYVDRAGAARIPLPTPETAPPEQEAYLNLLTRYNKLYAGLRALLVASNRAAPDVLLSEEELLEGVGSAFHDVEQAPKAMLVARQEDMAERERWQRQESRWRALATVADHKPSATVAEWIGDAQQLVRAVEADEFG
jgi:hypothetical protein